MKTSAALTLASLVLGACASAGMGPTTRNDITERMATTRDPIAACYATALKDNRRLRGTIALAITAEAKTGKFTGVKIVRDDLGDPTLNDCVVAEVSKLTLSKPTSTQVQFEYPLVFVPSDLAGQ